MNIAENIFFLILNCALSITQFTVSGLGAVKKLMVKLQLLSIHNDGTVRFRDVRTLPTGCKIRTIVIKRKPYQYKLTFAFMTVKKT